MITAQLVPLSIDRGAPRLFTIEITGIDLTGADLHAQIRLTRDAPGDPLVDLPKTTSGTAAGVRLVAVDTSGALPISWVRLQIPAMATGSSTGQLPPAAELGDDVTVYWDMFVTPNGRTTDQWFYGPVTVSATVTKAAALPAIADDPLPGADAVATLIGPDLSVTLAGAALIQPLVDRADGSAAAAIDAAAHAETKAQEATDAATLAQQQVDLALPKAGGTMSGRINMGGNPLEAVGDPDSDDDGMSRGYADARYPKRGDAVSLLAETDAAKIMTAAERIAVATVKPTKSGRDGFGLADPSGRVYLRVTPTTFEHPMLNPILASALDLSKSLGSSKSGRSGFSIADSAKRVYFRVTPTTFEHPWVTPILTAAQALSNSVQSPKSGRSGFSLADSSKRVYCRITPTSFEHPWVTPILTAAQSLGLAITQPKTGRDAFTLSDASKRVYLHVSPTRINHADTNAMRRSLTRQRKAIAGLTPTTYSNLAAIAEILHFIIYGQSLSLAYLATTSLTGTGRALSHALMFSGGVRPYDSSTDPAVIYASLQNLYEQDTPAGGGTVTGNAGFASGQTIAWSAAAMVRQLLIEENGIDIATLNQKMLFSASGNVGVDIYDTSGNPQLASGSAPFDRLKADITNGLARSAALGKSYLPTAMLWLGGESAYANGRSVATHETQFRQLVSDAQAFAQTTANTARPLPVITYQTATHLKYSVAVPNIALAQLDMALNDVNTAMAAPTYQLTYVADGVHLDRWGQLELGIYFGIAIKRWFFDGLKPMPLRAIATQRINTNTIIVTLSNTSPLVQDTSRATVASAGFTLADSGGSAIAISGVAVAGINQIRITAAAAIPANAEWRYAYTGPSTRGVGQIRDSQGDDIIFDPTPGGINLRAHNWLAISKGTIA